MALRSQVLSLYRRILRISKSWKAQNPAETVTERNYIRTEAQKLFRENATLKDETIIKEHIKEGETRLELAFHYEIPYPRISNIPQNQLPPTSKRKFKGRQKALQQAKPVYLKSYKETE